jgi:hypothetical protein
MKRFILAMALAFALSSTVLAGHIPTSDVAAPQPPQETTAPGEIHSTDSTAPSEVSSVGVSALLTLLSLAF